MKRYGIRMAALVLICVLAAVFSGEKKAEQSVVCVKTEAGVERLPVEEYLLGAMAAVADPDYETECLKALAVLLRGNLQAAEEERDAFAAQEPYLSFSGRRRLYGERQTECEEKLRAAVKATQGLVAVSGNTIVAGNYHAVSAGITRAHTGSESVVCDLSMGASDYFSVIKLEKAELSVLQIEERDEAGYVLRVKAGGNEMSGQCFCDRYGLPSANFETEETEEAYVVTVRGKGHGVGMDLFYANELAKRGLSFHDILDYFFADFILKKIIV